MASSRPVTPRSRSKVDGTFLYRSPDPGLGLCDLHLHRLSLIALPFLPVAQYPKVAPPQLSITTSYPGASPQDIYQGVTRQIEEELNGVEHLSYFESTSDTSGAMTITATFAA